MLVTIKLFATLRDGRFKQNESDLPEQSRVADVIKTLNLAPEEIAICLVNGRHVDQEQALQEGDTVSLFPPVGGG